MRFGITLLVLGFTTQMYAQTGCHASFSFHQTSGTMEINFTDSSTSPHAINSWLWDFGNGDTSTLQNPSHTYFHDSTYYVCLTIHDDHGCSDTFCHNVTVNPIVADSCHASFHFYQTSGMLEINFADSSTSLHNITSWLWDFGDGHTSTSQNPSHTYAHDSTYYVCLTIHDAHGCSSTSCHHVTVNSIIADSCNASFHFHQTSGALEINFADSSTSLHNITSWLWDFGDGHTSTLQNPSHTYFHDSTYYVCLTIHDAHGCSSTSCHHITVNPIMADSCHALFSFHQTSGALEINYTDSSTSLHNITSWLWDFGDGHTSTSQNPSHTYAHDSTYYVCLTIHDAHGCSSTSCHHITVNHVPQTGINDIQNFISNVLVYPNPANDKLQIQFNRAQSSDLKIEILNLLGETILIQSNFNSNMTTLNVTGLNTGIYFLQIIQPATNQQLFTQKFIKQ